MLDFTFSDSFETAGHWWLPESPDKRVAGVLKYSPEGITLDLHGVLGIESFARLGTMEAMGGQVQLLFGNTRDGLCTLFQLTHDGGFDNFTGVQESAFNVGFFVFGCHISDATATATSMSFDCSRLTEFVRAACFDVQEGRLQDGGLGDGHLLKTIRFVLPETVEWAIASDQSTVSISSSGHQRGGRGSTKMSIEVSHQLNVLPQRPQPLLWYFRRIWRLCQLLALLTDGFVTPKRAAVKIAGDPQRYLLCYVPSRRGGDSGRPTSFCFFYLADLSGQLGTIIDAWLAASDILAEAINLFSAGRSWTDSLEVRFQLLCQSLEAFSRATSSLQYMPNEDYESVKTTLIKSIPSVVSASHRTKLKSQITFGNEYSLRKRVENLLDSLQPETLNLICVSRSLFVKGVVNTRNYLTHYTDELRATALRDADLYWAGEKIALLVRVVLLKHVGIPEELICDRIRKYPPLAQCLLAAGNHREAL